MRRAMVMVRNVSKAYRIYAHPRHRLLEALWRGRRRYHREFWALRDVSFEVESGRTLGIVGMNGSGKSTLLQIIAGIVQPTMGWVAVQGRVASLLELGAGFNPEFTGRENVLMQAAIMGFPREETPALLPRIEAFAEIGPFIDQPVKTYSSGMFVRLAFAAAINVDPEILIVDEALAVGDALFQARCFAKFREFKERGITIIFITHDLNLVTTHCDQSLLLDQGTLVARGLPKPVVDEYNRRISLRRETASASGFKKPERNLASQESLSNELEWDDLFEINPNEDRYGTRKAEILEAGIFTIGHEPAQIL